MDRQEKAIRYLLGDLSEEEKAHLEEQYFLDDPEFEQFEVAEDELIERYVSDELAPEDAHRFEKLLISPRLSERVEVARLLAQRAAPPPPEEEPVETPKTLAVTPAPPHVGWWERFFGPAAAVPRFSPAFAMVLTFMLLTTVALIFVWSKLQTESQRLAQEQQQRESLRKEIEDERARYRELQAQTQQEKEAHEKRLEEFQRQLETLQRATPALVLPVFLSPGGGSRGGAGNAEYSVKVPHDVKSVGFNVNVTHGAADYSSYNALVRDIDSSKVIANRNGLKPISLQGRKYIKFNVNAKDLPPGSYNVHVDGITPAGTTDNFDDYPFHVSR